MKSARPSGVLIIILVLVSTALGFGWVMIGPDWRTLLSDPPAGRDLLFWSQGQRTAAFRMLDRIPFIVQSRSITTGKTVRTLQTGTPLDPALDVDAYMTRQKSAAIVILHNGKIRLERYGLGFDASGRWTSFSVAKSLTSTLVGAAIKDGFFGSLDDAVTKYIPELGDSAYEGVTIRHVLTMTSGVGWTEDYDDPNSDVARYDAHTAADGMDTTVSYMRLLHRAHPPGSRWNYSTGETNLVGVLVSRATGRPPARYLSEKIWSTYGMAHDASWLLGSTGHEMSGCCIQAATRDFARYGQFILEGGWAAGKAVLPDDWLAQATRKQVDIGTPNIGYGFQWWVRDDGAFLADGIFGQGIFIDPGRRLVIASNSSWTSANGDLNGEWEDRNAFYRAIQQAVDAETVSGS